MTTATGSRGVADTSLFVARESGRRLSADLVPSVLAVSEITVAELRVGVLAAEDVESRERRLSTLVFALGLDPLPVDGPVGEAWARLRLLLRDAGRRMPVNDSWIAATALAQGVPVVTQDDDYDAAEGLGGLVVVKV